LGRYTDQWYFWIMNDILQIAMFSGVAGFGVNFNILFMWCLFLVNAFYGLYCWFTYKPRGHHIVSGKETKVLDEPNVV
jgi:nicotinamide riboside transporter PnuC